MLGEIFLLLVVVLLQLQPLYLTSMVLVEVELLFCSMISLHKFFISVVKMSKALFLHMLKLIQLSTLSAFSPTEVGDPSLWWTLLVKQISVSTSWSDTPCTNEALDYITGLMLPYLKWKLLMCILDMGINTNTLLRLIGTGVTGLKTSKCSSKLSH